MTGMDLRQTLKDTENALKDFIAFILSENLGEEWETECGVSPERLSRWQELKEAAASRQETGVAAEPLISYADIRDLKTILQKHWQYFAPALGDQTTLEVYLAELAKLGDSGLFRRDFLPHHQNLILGISGELRTRMARYRSQQETTEPLYPRIEYAADNLGNSWRPGESNFISTGMKLRPGDLLELAITATDPLGEPLEYQYAFNTGSPGVGLLWSGENTFTFQVTDKYVGNLFFATLSIRSKRKYHAHGDHDDYVIFIYQVLPPG